MLYELASYALIGLLIFDNLSKPTTTSTTSGSNADHPLFYSTAYKKIFGYNNLIRHAIWILAPFSHEEPSFCQK